MKTKQKKNTTFGEFIAATYATCGRKKAKGIIRIAFKAHWAEFLGHDRFIIS